MSSGGSAKTACRRSTSAPWASSAAIAGWRQARLRRGSPPAPPTCKPQDPDEQYDRIDLTRTFSTREVLREKDFAEFTPEETLQARQLMALLRWSPGLTANPSQGAG